MKAKDKKLVEDVAEIRAILRKNPQAIDYLSPLQRAVCQTLLSKEEKGNTTAAGGG